MNKKYESLTKKELIALIEQKDKLLSNKEYGLVWADESEQEDVVLLCQKNKPIIVEDKSKAIKTDDSVANLLIEGDNFHSLTVLKESYFNQVDFIYIDPPYNTGSKNDFKYNDCWVTKNDSCIHSKWLNFMYKRLLLAKDLMSNSGVIFISIGEKELSNLNLVCEKIFGRENFLTIITRLSKSASDKGSHFAPSCDYIICYAKDKNSLNPENFYEQADESLYKKSDEYGKYRDDVAFYQASLDPLRGCINQRYFIKAPDGSYLIPPGVVFPEKISDAAFVRPKSKNDKVWRWSYETYLKQKDLLVFKQTKNSPLVDENGKKAKYNVYTKSYYSQRSEKGVKPRNFLTDKKFLNRKGTDHLKTMGLNFTYSKPKELVMHLLSIVHLPNDALILDFFAGSGTTGEAVLELNQKEKTQRRFILCTNNEENICSEICYPRIKKVITGYIKNEDKETSCFVEGLGGNLLYYKTGFFK